MTRASAARFVLLVTTFALTTGCSTLQQLSAGPSVALSAKGGVGGEVDVREGAGSAEDVRVGFEWTAHARATNQLVQLGVGLGLHAEGDVGPVLLYGRGASWFLQPEWSGGRLRFGAAFGAEIGVGVVLSEKDIPDTVVFGLRCRRDRVYLTLSAGLERDYRGEADAVSFGTIRLGIAWSSYGRRPRPATELKKPRILGRVAGAMFVPRQPDPC